MRWWQLRKRDADLERELRSDLELEEAEQRESGLQFEEARYAARRAFGNPTLIREQTHEAWGSAQFERCWRDVHYALRQIRKSPGFSTMVVLVLAMAISGKCIRFQHPECSIVAAIADPKRRQTRADYVDEGRKAGRCVRAGLAGFCHSEPDLREGGDL